MSDKAYSAEVDTPGCEACGLGARWNVVGPDDVATSTIYEDQELAEEVAEDLSAAYRAGQTDALNGLKRRRAETDERRKSGTKPENAPADGERRVVEDGRRLDDGIPF